MWRSIKVGTRNFFYLSCTALNQVLDKLAGPPQSNITTFFVMPGRQSHGGAPSKKPKAKNNSKKRALDAYSIAAHQNPEVLKVRQSRLGASEGGSRPGKRRRNDEEEELDDEDEEQSTKKQRKGPAKGRFDELDVDEGSDSEGNEWKMGQVDSDDDSELDSDEAFGESDEERFDGFGFFGSTDKKSKKKTARSKDVDLDEDESEDDSDSELGEGDLGEDAIDLADMLNTDTEDEEEVSATKKKQKHQPLDSDEEPDSEIDEPSIWKIEPSAVNHSDDEISGLATGSKHTSDDESSSGDEEDGEEYDNPSDVESMSSADDNDAPAPTKRSILEDAIESVAQRRQIIRQPPKKVAVKDYDLTSTEAITMEDFGFGTTSKISSAKSKGNRKGAGGALDVPLAKREQDRIDRKAAYEKSKEELGRWQDTVIHNRRAEHLMFPLPDADLASTKANNVLMPTTTAKPFNELEATIQSIMEASGLDGKDAEDRIREAEDLEVNKMSMEEIMEGRRQLRAKRELMFREEARAKRVKKIKSKSYRRVHRKEREKEERKNKEALAEAGVEPSEDELEAQDRRRATERMGAKHRGSKWAKGTKEIGRAVWDEDARAGMTEMARRDEELRKRVEGHSVRKDDDGSDISLSESEDDSEDDDTIYQKNLLKKLKSLGGQDEKISGPGSKLANMAFMRKAAAAKKEDTDALVEEIRREITGEDAPSEDEDLDIGRRIFGPGSSFPAKIAKRTDDEIDAQAGDNNSEAENSVKPTAKLTSKSSKSRPLSTAIESAPAASEGGAWSTVTTKPGAVNEAEAQRRRHKKNDAIEAEELDLSKAAVMTSQAKPKKAAKKSTTLDVDSDDDSNDDNAQLPFAMRDHDLIKRAFAGADVVGEFEAEKRKTIEDEDEKVVDETVPGWGSWVGDGLTKREKARNKGRVMTKVDGIKEKNRKDGKLQNVIINQKRVKKVCLSLTWTAPVSY